MSYGYETAGTPLYYAVYTLIFNIIAVSLRHCTMPRIWWVCTLGKIGRVRQDIIRTERRGTGRGEGGNRTGKEKPNLAV